MCVFDLFSRMLVVNLVSDFYFFFIFIIYVSLREALIGLDCEERGPECLQIDLQSPTMGFSKG